MHRFYVLMMPTRRLDNLISRKPGPWQGAATIEAAGSFGESTDRSGPRHPSIEGKSDSMLNTYRRHWIWYHRRFNILLLRGQTPA